MPGIWKLLMKPVPNQSRNNQTLSLWQESHQIRLHILPGDHRWQPWFSLQRKSSEGIKLNFWGYEWIFCKIISPALHLPHCFSLSARGQVAKKFLSLPVSSCKSQVQTFCRLFTYIPGPSMGRWVWRPHCHLWRPNQVNPCGQLQIGSAAFSIRAP